MVRSTAVRQATLFLLLVFAMTTAIALALPHSPATPILSLFTPALSVVVLTLVATARRNRRLLWRDMGFRRPGVRTWPAATAMPLLFLGVAYGTAVALGVATLRLGHPSLPAALRSAPDFLILVLAGPIVILGEEIGWRGFLLPVLQTIFPRPKAALLTGFAHGLFHLPAILLTTTYDAVGSRFVVAPAVVATITFAGIFYGWLRDKSGSVWPVAIAHNTANVVFGLGAAAAVTTSPAALAYTAGESGIATFVGVASVGIWLYTRAAVWHQQQVVATTFAPAR